MKLHDDSLELPMWRLKNAGYNIIIEQFNQFHKIAKMYQSTVSLKFKMSRAKQNNRENTKT